MKLSQPYQRELSGLPDLVLTMLFDRLDATTLVALRLVSRSYNDLVLSWSAFSLISKLNAALAALALPPEIDHAKRPDDALTKDGLTYQKKLQSLVFLLSDLKSRNPVDPVPEPFGRTRDWEENDRQCAECKVENAYSPSPPARQQTIAVIPFDFDRITVLFDRKYLNPRVCRYRGVEMTLLSGVIVILVLQMGKTFFDGTECGDARLSMVLPATEKYAAGQYTIFTWGYEDARCVNGYDIRNENDAAARAADILGIEKSGPGFKAVVDAVCPNLYNWEEVWRAGDDAITDWEHPMMVDFSAGWRERYHITVPEEFAALVNATQHRLLTVPACTTAAIVNGMIQQIRSKQALVGLRRVGGFCGMLKAVDCTDPPMGVSNYFYDRDAWDPILMHWFKTHVNVIEAWSEQAPRVYESQLRRSRPYAGAQKALEMKVIFELKPAHSGRKPVRIIFHHRIGVGINIYGESRCTLHAVVDNRILTIIDVHRFEGNFWRRSWYNPPFDDTYHEYKLTRGSEPALTAVLEYLEVSCPQRDFMRLLIAGAYAMTVRVVAYGGFDYSVRDVLLRWGDHQSDFKRWFEEDPDVKPVDQSDVQVSEVPEGDDVSALEVGSAAESQPWETEASMSADMNGMDVTTAEGSASDGVDGDVGDSYVEVRDRSGLTYEELKQSREELVECLMAVKKTRDNVSRIVKRYENGESDPEASESEPEDVQLVQSDDAQPEEVQSEVSQLEDMQSGDTRSEEVQAGEVQSGEMQSGEMQLGEMQLEEMQSEEEYSVAVRLERMQKLRELLADSDRNLEKAKGMVKEYDGLIEREEWKGPPGRSRCGMQEDVKALFDALWERDKTY
ncbi:hypothetical protein HDV00_002859 [Rhizophlyctis rosea]|nr:hypothetical protein HDV00_002859 [Rhizophlyctis rosea]